MRIYQLILNRGLLIPRLKSTTLQNESLVKEQQVFYILDHLQPTAQGLDNIPACFLRLLAPVISAWVAQLFNLSINTYWIPPNWKTFIISPVPKIAAPLAPSDYRPISVVPILSRILERIVVQRYIYPAMEDPLMAAQIKDQFAFRPTGSTTAAQIALLDHVTTLLRSNAYVLIVSMDFTKAFDSVRHSTLMEKMAALDIPDNIYNWVVNYFKDRDHITSFREAISTYASINASIIQGSGFDPSSYVVVASDLHPLQPVNILLQYADDTYLLVGVRYIQSAAAEFDNISRWAAAKNLRLNQIKKKELIVRRKRTKLPSIPELPFIQGGTQVTSLRVRGTTINSTLSMSDHIDAKLATCSSSIYILRTLKKHLLFPPWSQKLIVAFSLRSRREQTTSSLICCPPE